MRLPSSENGEDVHGLDNSTGRRQQIHVRVSTVEGVSVGHSREGEDTVGCRAHLIGCVQYPEVRSVPSQVRYAKQRYVIRFYSTSRMETLLHGL